MGVIILSINTRTDVQAGLPYGDIVWSNITGQPFGAAVYFNGLILGTLSNLIDVEGPVAVAGNCVSPRGMSVSYGSLGSRDIPLSPLDVRYLAGGATQINGPLTVIGHAMSGTEAFLVGSGSSYSIGKSGVSGQLAELKSLYAASGGSAYWTPVDDSDCFVIPCYDVSRYLPASRAGSDPAAFFADASLALNHSAESLMGFSENGTVRLENGSFFLTGTDAAQNVFLVDLRGMTEFTGNIDLSVPEGSHSVVQLLVPDTLTIRSAFWGAAGKEQTTVFVISQPSALTLRFPTVLYGGLLAPQVSVYAATSGGNINGTTVLSELRVQESSGFELHWFPFSGGISIDPECPECPECPVCPDCPECPDCIVKPGILSGRIQSDCCWKLCLRDLRTNQILRCIRGSGNGRFYFKASADGNYRLELTGSGTVLLENVGISTLSIAS